ncbi:MAG: ribokinase [Bacteroidota bacterium]
MKSLLVIGSSNTDMVIKTARFPQPGETIIGGDFFMFAGGKGANQAVAAARLGAKVNFICSVGDDVFGQNALENYRKEGIGVDHAQVCVGEASGIAMITVNQEGENEIVVASGSNRWLGVDLLRAQQTALEEARLILTQLETPVEGLTYLAKAYGEKLILNPAPAQALSASILTGIWLITPNETEASLLSGITVKDVETAEQAAYKLLALGVQNVIVTLGAKGALFVNKEESWLHPTVKVQAIDTTAAGDVFNGALLVALDEGKSWKEAVAFACKAATFSVQTMGAQSSAPFRKDLVN